MKRQVHIFLTAIMFLTRIRVPPVVDHSPAYLKEAPRYFPVVGWIVGMVSALVYLLGSRFLSTDAGVLAAMVTGILVTGAFHEDGFADVCDGFGGGWTKEKILLIMKDSRIGAYGAIGLILLLGTKFLLLKELPAFTPALEPAAAAASGSAAAASGFWTAAPQNIFYDHRYAILAIICAHSLGRLMPVLVMQAGTYARAGLPYAGTPGKDTPGADTPGPSIPGADRPGEGTPRPAAGPRVDAGAAAEGKSAAFAGRRMSIGGVVAAVVFALAPFAFLPWQYLLVIVPVLYATFELNRYFKRWIGGYTGDCLGAIEQVSEIMIYLGFVLIFRYF
ncbi:MAG TPA: adenosylcobinamide-GDP ribazoletransferase [Puia sp.]|nr:adenosylcobinamide-GDP ribazoletransferase [Puia sp.]